MSSRGGLPIKNFLFGGFIIATLGLLYVYNSSQGRLKDAQLLAARNRREIEEKVADMQDLLKTRDELQERFEKEKHELINKLKSVNQNHDMLKSQHTEMEADFMKLKQDLDNVKEEHSKVEGQHQSEYLSYKQEKEIEISKLKDQLVDSQRQYESLQINFNQLKSQLEKAQDANQALMIQKSNLLLQQKQLESQQQQQQQQRHEPQQQQLEQNIRVNSEARGDGKAQLDTRQNINQANGDNNAGVGKDSRNGQGFLNMNVDDKNQNLDGPNDQLKMNNDFADLNAKKQVLPPILHNEDRNNEEDNQERNGDSRNQADGKEKDSVNPNDLQKHQILGPNVGGDDNPNEEHKLEAGKGMESKPIALQQDLQQMPQPHNVKLGESLDEQRDKPPVVGKDINENKEEMYNDQDADAAMDEMEEEEEEEEEDEQQEYKDKEADNKLYDDKIW